MTMINCTISLNGVKVSHELPTTWAEVKFKHFLAVARSPKDTTAILSVLTGIEYETLKKAKIANVDDIILAISFFNQDAELKVPEKILSYTVPKDLGFECTAQYEDLQLHLKECKDKNVSEVDMLAFYPLYCAIYACSQKHEAYNWQKAEEMAEEFMNAPATEVLAIGNFTLLKLIGLKLGIKKDAPKPVTRLMRWRLVLKSWVMSLVLPVQLYIWKRKHLTKKASY